MTDLIALQKIAGWEKLKTLVLDSVSSPITKRVYNMALDEFPRVGGDIIGHSHQPVVIVSIHAPRVGGDRYWPQSGIRIRGFNPRPPRGGRQPAPCG